MTLTSGLVVVVLTLLTALYVAAEFAAVSVRRSRVRQLAEDGHAFALRLRPFVESPQLLDHYIAASQIGITLTSLVIGAYGQAAIAPDLSGLLMAWTGADADWARTVSSVTTLVVLTVFNVLFGELMPKSLALQYPTQTALATIVPMQWSLWLYKPFIGFLNGSGLLFLRLLGIRQTGHRHIHSPEELELLIAESRDGGLLEPHEHRRLQQALRLRLRTARDLMVPWEAVEAIDADTPLPEIVDRLSLSAFTRIPVYRGSRDRVIGVLNTKKLALRRLRGAIPRDVSEMLQPVAVTAPTTTGDRLLALFRERKTHQAVVTDEAGRALGLVALDDVLRESLGEVPDGFKVAVEPLAQGEHG